MSTSSRKWTSFAQTHVNSAGRNQPIPSTSLGGATDSHATILAALRPVDCSQYSVPSCMPGTRRRVIQEIDDWIENPHAPNILWLSGIPGTGKSTIASTVVARLAEAGKLGSSFFCKRTDSNLNDPTAVWRTVAFDLARADRYFAEELINNLNENKSIVDRADIHSHFKYFIEEPCNASWKRGTQEGRNVVTKVVVMDAIDECGFEESQHRQRRIFIETITRWSQMHSHFKLLVTGQDHLMPASFRTICQRITLETGERTSSDTHADIRTFFGHQFTELAAGCPQLRSWPGQSTIEQLTAQSGGLFVWADIVMRFLRQGIPEDQLKILMEGAFRKKGDIIDLLYTQILQHSFSHPNILDTTRRVLGAIVLAKTPLHRVDLRHFLGKDERQSNVEIVLRRLSSVISIEKTDGRIHVCHLSFIEFLCNRRRCPQNFFIDHSVHNRIFTDGCLRVMKEHLRFNIGNIETSYLKNDHLNLPMRIKRYLPTYLLYSCAHWAEHLRATKADVDILDAVKEFMMIRLLFWLEVLSLTKDIPRATHTLTLLYEWNKTYDSDLAAFAVDAQRFVATFSPAISASVPHLYLSALPFAPQQSRISQVYLSRIQRALSISSGKSFDWPTVLNVLTGHSGTVMSVSFSHDGRRIASASTDRTIRVWDAESARLLSCIRNSIFSIQCLAFSPDDRHVVSGSLGGGIMISDVETGALISRPSMSDAHAVVRCIVYSPSGKRVAAGLEDGSVCIWNTLTSEVTLHRLHSNVRVLAISFSRDGDRIISCSAHGMIRSLNANTGGVLHGLSLEHTSFMQALAFSHDGTRIASESSDGDVRIWDVATGDMLVGPQRGSSRPTWSPSLSADVPSVSFSVDDDRIVCGSTDGSIHIRDAHNGKLILGPLLGHTSIVSCVALSTDGSRLVSGSADRTIRIWDTNPTEFNVGSSRRKGRITSVTLSPDGKRLAFVVMKTTVYVSDTQTGEFVSGPFEHNSGPVRCLAFSYDCTQIISASDACAIHVWDANTGAAMSHHLHHHSGSIAPDRILSIAFSKEDRRIVTGHDSGKVCFSDAASGRYTLRSYLTSTHNDCTAMALSHLRKRIILGSRDGDIYFYNANSRKTVWDRLRVHTGRVLSVSFSEDDQRVVTGSSDGTLCCWNAVSGNIISRLSLGQRYDKLVLAFSHDANRVVAGSTDGTKVFICIWDALTGTPISGPLNIYTSDFPIRTLTISEDGTHLASGSRDGVVRIWTTGINESRPRYAAIWDNSELSSDGWVIGPNSRLLFWIPPAHRRGLLWKPRNISVIGDTVTKLDLSSFVHGESWRECCVHDQ